MHDSDVFMNPMAPVSSDGPNSKSTNIQKQNLSNEDFRKLMSTPATNHTTSTPAFGAKHHATASVRGHRRQVIINEEFKKPESTASTDKKKNKKKFYQKKKEEDEENLLAELAKRYRDRAKERREHSDEPDDHQLNTSSYHAVANCSSEDAAERRRQLIEESKYLGGDMEHTHLVKGLDYALLQKVKTEIEFDRDQETLKMVENELNRQSGDSDEEADSDSEEQDWAIKSPLAKNLLKILFETPTLPERNEYFLPGRLAYVFDLENDCPTDAYTTIIRSKADCPNWESLSTLSTNDIVLNKLIEIFGELKELGGKRRKKTQKTELSEEVAKFNFLNQSCGFRTPASNLIKDSFRSSRFSEVETKDLNSIYDQDLNFDVIKNPVVKKVENDLDIYDDIGDDYVLPHHKLDERSDRRESSTYSSRYDRDDNRPRKDDERPRRDDRKRRSSSRDRYRRSSSSEEYRRDRRESYSRREEMSRRDDYHRDDRHYSTSKRKRH